MTDKMREEFEVYCKREHLGTTSKDCDGDYFNPMIDMLWHCWKASRAALCVELPSRMNQSDNDHYACGFDNALYAAEIKMEMAGVSYK